MPILCFVNPVEGKTVSREFEKSYCEQDSKIIGSPWHGIIGIKKKLAGANRTK